MGLTAGNTNSSKESSPKPDDDQERNTSIISVEVAYPPLGCAMHLLLACVHVMPAHRRQYLCQLTTQSLQRRSRHRLTYRQCICTPTSPLESPPPVSYRFRHADSTQLATHRRCCPIPQQAHSAYWTTQHPLPISALASTWVNIRQVFGDFFASFNLRRRAMDLFHGRQLFQRDKPPTSLPTLLNTSPTYMHPSANQF